ncbi:MAG TPA: FMN reductase [Nocardioidaceae bacterium]|jgi:FMN reductase
MTRRIVVVSGGLSEPSTTRLLADRLAASVEKSLTDERLIVGRQVDGLEVSVVELRDVARDITDALLTRVPSAALQTVIDAVTSADGLVAVSPVFNASYSGLFKSFFDVLDADDLAGTPVLIAATGGTERHSLALEHALRPLFSYLHALVVPTAVFAATSDWGSREYSARLSARIDRATGELARLVAEAPAVAQPTDPYDDPTPFEELLFGSPS